MTTYPPPVPPDPAARAAAPWRWSALEVAAATRAGEVSCREVARSVLGRIADVNPRLNAITLELADQALAQAAALDERFARGEQLGPLHGVPITIKDNVDVRGQRTPNGLPGLAELIAPDDSPVTANLRAAGAVIVGRTNTPEVSMRPTTNNPLYGLTLNPWDAGTSCGGSSGGAGAAVVAGMGALGHGNDIGGSIRIPALHCGVPGIKPTQGRVPAFVPSATVERTTVAALMSVQGLLGRTVADLRTGLAVLSGRDPRDPWWVPAPLAGPPVPRRAAVLRGLDGEPTDPGVLRALDRAGVALAAAGYQVVEVDEAGTPGLGTVGRLAFRLMMADLNHQLLPLLERLGSDQILRYWAVVASMAEPYGSLGEHLDDLARRTTVTRDWMLFLERYPVLVVPEMLSPLLRVDGDVASADDTRRVWRALLPSIAMNLMGLPSVLAPTGLDGGLPTGVQLVTSRFREDVALDAAEAVEQVVGPLAPLLWARPADA
ncbi:MAG TPA: amidase [Kineosporiaceae bacterium]